MLRPLLIAVVLLVDQRHLHEVPYPSLLQRIKLALALRAEAEFSSLCPGSLCLVLSTTAPGSRAASVPSTAANP
ncbi:hypothetical protein CMUS01_16677, partial [Colletotrichum musicola]